MRRGQWEGAWALAQLHYDQLLKQEAARGTRQHKGSPLCNLALLGQAIGSPSLTLHYALLSSAGDVYWENKDPGLKDGGLAPTILERFESQNQQNNWRSRIRSELTSFGDDKPVYLESFLATRWFTETYAKNITNLAEVANNYGKPFADLLLDSIENPKDVSDTTTGARFEAATGILLSATPGFQVDSGRKTTDEQIDLVVYYVADDLAPIGLELDAAWLSANPRKAESKRESYAILGRSAFFIG